MRVGTTSRMIAGCCALVAAASGPAAAEPARSPDLPLPGSLVAAIARDLRIDAREYVARAGTAERLTGFETLAGLAYPRVFAGVRMDGTHGVVAVAEGIGAADARHAAEQAGFTVESAAESMAALLTRRGAFERWLAEQPAAVTDGIRGYGIDVEHNALTVRVVAGTRLPAEAGSVRTVPDDRPRTGPGPEDTPPGIGFESEADADFIGGQPFGVNYRGHTPRCTLGFNGADADGHAVNITAGHCDPNNWFDPAASGDPQPVYEIGADGRAGTVGHFTESELGPHDWGVIRVADSYASRFRNNLVSTRSVPGAENDPADGPQLVRAATETLTIDGTADPVAGAPVCKTGLMTGYTCGTVDSVDQTFLIAGVPGDEQRPVRIENMFTTGLCSRRGDSGGPVFMGSKAVGLTSSGKADETLPAPRCGPAPLHIVQPIGVVLRENPG